MFEIIAASKIERKSTSKCWCCRCIRRYTYLSDRRTRRFRRYRRTRQFRFFRLFTFTPAFTAVVNNNADNRLPTLTAYFLCYFPLRKPASAQTPVLPVYRDYSPRLFSSHPSAAGSRRRKSVHPG